MAFRGTDGTTSYYTATTPLGMTGASTSLMWGLWMYVDRRVAAQRRAFTLTGTLARLSVDASNFTYAVAAGQVTTAVTNAELGQWTHFGLTYDSANVRAYMNGVEIGSAAYTGSIAADTELRIGGNATSQTTSYWLSDFFIAENTPFTPETMMGLANGSMRPPDIVQSGGNFLYFPFDNGLMPFFDNRGSTYTITGTAGDFEASEHVNPPVVDTRRVTRTLGTYTPMLWATTSRTLRVPAGVFYPGRRYTGPVATSGVVYPDAW